MVSKEPFSPFPDPAETPDKATDTVVDTPIRISLSGKTGPGYEAGLINVSGTVDEVARFLKLDPESDTFRSSPFAAIVGVWNKGHVWAQKNYNTVKGD